MIHSQKCWCCARIEHYVTTPKLLACIVGAGVKTTVGKAVGDRVGTENGPGEGVGRLVGLLLGRMVGEKVVGDLVGWVLGDTIAVLATHTAPLDKKSPGPPTAKKSPSSRDRAIENPGQIRKVRYMNI